METEIMKYCVIENYKPSILTEDEYSEYIKSKYTVDIGLFFYSDRKFNNYKGIIILQNIELNLKKLVFSFKLSNPKKHDLVYIGITSEDIDHEYYEKNKDEYYPLSIIFNDKKDYLIWKLSE